MSIARPRSQTITEGDWVTLNEVVRDLSFAVNQLADLEEAPAAYAATVRLRADAPSIGVPLPGEGQYEWSLTGVGAGATVFIAGDDGGTVSWANWTITASVTRATGSGTAGALGFASATDRLALHGTAASAGTGWCYEGTGKLSNTTARLVSGQGNRQLGKLLQFSGGFKAGTVLSVRRLG